MSLFYAALLFETCGFINTAPVYVSSLKPFSSFKIKTSLKNFFHIFLVYLAVLTILFISFQQIKNSKVISHMSLVI